MGDEKFKDAFKILVLGSEGVGKTTLLERYSDRILEKDVAPILGVNFFIKHINITGHDYKLQFWDFLNDQKFESLHTLYYTGASAILFIFDLSRPETFNYHKECLKKIWHYVNLNRWPLLLIGNKLDAKNDLVDTKKYQDFVKKEGLMGYIELSIENISALEEVIPNLIKEVMARRILYSRRVLGRIKKDVFGELKNTAIPDHIQGSYLEKPNQEALKLRQLEKQKRMEELEKVKEVLKKTNQVKFLVDDEELEEIKKYAQLFHQSQSEFIRTAIWEKIRSIDLISITQNLKINENFEDNQLRREELRKIRSLLENLRSQLE